VPLADRLLFNQRLLTEGMTNCPAGAIVNMGGRSCGCSRTIAGSARETMRSLLGIRPRERLGLVRKRAPAGEQRRHST